MKLCLLDPDRIYRDWHWLRNGVLDVIEKTNVRYRPEDVWHRLRSGTAWVYALEHRADELGFIIFTQEFDPDGLVLFVWIMWAEPGSAAKYQREIFDALSDLARSLKAKRIRMQSPLKGWGRVDFFTNVATVYEHEVDL